MITVKFFAMLKNLSKAESKVYEIPAPITVEDLKAMLKKDFPGLAPALDSRSILISVNQEFATKKTVIKDGDEIGLLPPFSGG